MLLYQQKNNILPRSFYARDTVIVARELIGQILVRITADGIRAGIITETEAYRGDDDPACHAYRGKTNRTAPLFGTVGSAYVYFIYGNHFCFNIVARSSEQRAGGVLIRAIQPIAGIDQMKKFRGSMHEKMLTNGPGKLTQALEIAHHHNYLDCTQVGEIFVSEGQKQYQVDQTPRIGISHAEDKLWRFIVKK